MTIDELGEDLEQQFGKPASKDVGRVLTDLTIESTPTEYLSVTETKKSRKPIRICDSFVARKGLEPLTFGL